MRVVIYFIEKKTTTTTTLPLENYNLCSRVCFYGSFNSIKDATFIITFWLWSKKQVAINFHVS